MPARHPRLLYAHRGAAVELPENTLPAFRRAAEIGVDAIETDVHLTADGHVLVSHDPSALRMTGVGVAWRDLTLDQARALDVGWGFVDRAGQRPHLGRGIRVCTLEEALRELPHLRFNVDLKVHTPSPVPTVLALLRRLGAEERVTLASFHARTLLEVRRRGYAGETARAQAEVAALLALPEMVVRNLPFLASAAQLPTHAGPLRFDRPAWIARCHRLGMRVDFWTINEPAEARRLLTLGADGIMSDDPAAIAPVFRAMASAIS